MRGSSPRVREAARKAKLAIEQAMEEEDQKEVDYVYIGFGTLILIVILLIIFL